MAQAVSRRPLTAETRVRSRVSPCGIYFYFLFVCITVMKTLICGDKVALRQVFLRVFQFYPVNLIPPVLHYTEKRKKKTNHRHHRVAQ
jgi:hypothetical protein